MTHTPFEQMTKSSLKNFRQKSTDDLIQIWIKNEQNYQVSELNAVFHILLERGVEIPLPNDDQLRIENPNSSLIPPVKSNASLRELRPGKLEFRFPNEGFLHIGRFEFKDNDDLLSYLHQSFKGSIESQGIRGSITRKGKYQRVDDDSQPIFTFGDPVLDIITNRHGLLIIDGKVHNMRSQAIESGMQRGGISSMDLSPFLDDVSKTQVAKIAMGESNFVLLESSLDGITIASSNPSTLYFQKGSKRMRFRAWRTNLTAYWSMGAEIETWGGILAEQTYSETTGTYLAVNLGVPIGITTRILIQMMTMLMNTNGAFSAAPLIAYLHAALQVGQELINQGLYQRELVMPRLINEKIIARIILKI